MLRLLASAPEDGWAYVEDGDSLLVIRPPYAAWSRAKVQRSTLETAIQRHGFGPEDRAFPDWASLIAHLKEQIIESHRARGDEEPTSESIRKLFHFAPRYILVEYLDRIKSELLPKEWGAAETILTELLQVDMVRTDNALFERALKLLSCCQEARIAEEKDRLELVNQEQSTAQFRRIFNEYGRAVSRIQEFLTRRGPLMVGG